ncbi:transcriptional repressor p66 alpha-like isoform X2 [Notothenia coriiceps]|nr:PREDICTED: transcriptional repressor p66 alpha-like isoform X2 [Notothenia coriiceps]
MKAEKLVSHQLKQAHARASSMHHLQQASRGSNMVYHHSIKQSSQGQLSHGVSSLGLRGVPHSFSSSSQLQSAVAAAALVSRPGKHASPPLCPEFKGEQQWNRRRQEYQRW